MEIRIKVRTAELTKANEDLRREVSKHRKTQEQLAESEMRYRAIVEDQTELICRFNSEGILLFVNEAYCRYFNKKCEDLIGKSFFELIVPEDRARVESKIKELSLENPVLTLEEKVFSPDGSIRWQQWDNRIIISKDGGIVEYQAVGRDITERKRYEDTLMQNDRFLSSIFASIQDGISILDKDMNIVRVNATMEKWYSHAMPLIGKKCYQAYHCRDRACEVCPTKNTIQNKESSFDIVPKRTTGGVINGWLGLYSFPLIDKQSQEMIGVIEYVRDITAEKNALATLNEEKERLRIALHAARAGAWDWDIANNKVKWSKEYYALFEIDEAMDQPSYENWLNNVHEQDRESAANAVKLVFEQGGDEINHEYRILRKDGNIKWINGIGKVFRGQDGKPLRMIGIAIDITERKKVEEELAKYRNHLEELIKMRTHELERQIQERRDAEKESSILRQQIEFILGATKTGLDIIDTEYNIVYIDPAWQGIYGDHVGKKCYEYFMDKKEPCPCCGVRKAFETKKITITEETLPKEGNRPIQVTTIPFLGEDGRWYVAEVNVDISERKKAEEELKKYKERLEELVEERTAELEKEIEERKKAESAKEELNVNLLNSNIKLKQISLMDSLTGLYNYRFLTEIIEAEYHRARRYIHPLTVMMLDIDYFKSINGVYGHEFGDLVLKQFAKQLKRMVRRYDIVVRSSGEEFVIISPGIDRAQALTLGRRLLDSLNLFNFGDKKHTIKIKVSIAISSYPEDTIIKGIDLINMADNILNIAKERGGNRVYTSLDVRKIGFKKSGKDQNINILKNKIDKLTKKANQGLSESILAFAKTIELKDHYTGEHVENTVQYATRIARALELPAEEIELVRQAAILHDLGKIGISERILQKPAKLTAKEYLEIKKHPQIGADILRPIQFLHGLIPFIFYHHERWDGKGYPTGLKGDEIPVGARIIAIADVYQALTSERPYRKAYSKHEALKIIEEGSGKQFDPRIAHTFLKILKAKR